MRHLLAVVPCSSILAPAAAAAQPEWWRAGGPRIRPQDQRLTDLLQAGVSRSVTFRALVDRASPASSPG